ncbi:carbohydrate kinase [Neolewinella lacunae]|uniref:Carbohydrate kinase n=1 Tax=Neolewinella lacunae TaxID=1517758 RepID=A0A923PNS7_9BACT|nr:carbohydrate kinase [Neolewinella lacunae]MBC6993907.1 carbohydrate kinase [Neolewinella lacunae]MDN3635011.1 carbohydrate kinase [Neolewinella lacunae]
MTSTAPATAPLYDRPAFPAIVCFGETLIDLMPTAKRIGGAPLNVAYHVQRLGGRSAIISRVGRDELGKDILAFIREHGLDALPVPVDEVLETGTVGVTFRNRETPEYTIHGPVAWDQIGISEETKTAVSMAQALVFGSLAARSETNLSHLRTLLFLARVRVMDVNLRAPFFNEKTVRELLGHADLVKVNEEELRVIGAWCGWWGDDRELLGKMLEKFGLGAVVLTRGGKGATLLDHSGYYEHPGIAVEVADSIGAGDAFLAAFLIRYLGGEGPAVSLAYACRVGAYVASQTGGTPNYSLKDLVVEKRIPI